MDVPPLSPESVLNLSQIEFLPMDTNRLRHATQVDPVLSKIRLYTQRGWPNDVNPELKPYVTRAHSGSWMFALGDESSNPRFVSGYTS